MNNNNKILTVSYGTFSCTLEGFDDSFDTMKAIAEYFRDLASDDRYFGAEPPQPDADMLAKIAEREAARRVEAREHEGKIMLTAHEDAALPVAVSPAVAETAKTETSPEPDLAPVAEEAPTKEALPEIEEVETVAKETDTIVAASSAPVFEPEEIASVDEVDETPQNLAETDCDPDETVGYAQPDEVLQAAEDMADTVADVKPEEGTVDFDAAASFFSESTTPETAVVDVEEELLETVPAASAWPRSESAERVEDFEVEEIDAPVNSLAGESLADKLQRIRAVVSKADTVEDETEFLEDTEEPVHVCAFEDLGELLTPTPDAEEMPEAAREDTDIKEPAAQPEMETLSEASMSDEPANTVVAEATHDISEAFDIDDAFAGAHASVENHEIDDDLEALLRRIEEDQDEADTDMTLDLGEEIDADESVENLFSTDADDSDSPDVHGRVLKVDRAELEAALDKGELEEIGSDDAAVSALLDDETALDEDFQDGAFDDAISEPSAARESLPDINTGEGEDVSRLMAEADQQMQEPDGKTRRSAFAHLRAAVAARFADRSMGEAEKKVEEETEAYRSDLAEVVKPRRPIATTRTERPAEERPAPLKLVAEQRIDAETTMQRGPVAPRRVAAADEFDSGFSEDSGFADYAEEHGAEDLPELLEAAAAYLSYVEGHEQFSRPQLMAHVRQAHCGDLTREDGLRSFGQLLRTGKIEKIKGGRFAASDAIGFKPDHRAAG